MSQEIKQITLLMRITGTLQASRPHNYAVKRLQQNRLDVWTSSKLLIKPDFCHLMTHFLLIFLLAWTKTSAFYMNSKPTVNL